MGKRKADKRKQAVRQQILDALAGRPEGLTKTEIIRDVLHNKPRINVDTVLRELADEGLVTITIERREIKIVRTVPIEVIRLAAPPVAS
jgi:Fe2+ or Zn2+ uptake regulation protein